MMKFPFRWNFAKFL